MLSSEIAFPEILELVFSHGNITIISTSGSQESCQNSDSDCPKGTSHV